MRADHFESLTMTHQTKSNVANLKQLLDWIGQRFLHPLARSFAVSYQDCNSDH